MLEQVKEHVKVLFKDAKIQGFLGLKDDGGNVFPFVFSSAEELDDGFSLGKRETGPPARYPMAQLVRKIVCAQPEKTLGVLVRGCDERALNELKRWNQLPNLDEQVVKVGFACMQDLADAHECRQPYPEELVAGEKAEPVSNKSVDEIDALDLQGKLEYWKPIFDRCIKCYGCRDVCPVCFCNVCTLEDDMLITTGDLPPENPMFHLTRAVHMAGRCIDCNLCTEVCPAHIPLRTLYKKVAEIVKDEFGFTTGLADDGKSPLHILGQEPGHTTADE